MTSPETSPAWRTLHPTVAPEVSESRLQLHYAAQFATALGISYLSPKADDSHTNLGWDTRHEALKSRAVHSPAHVIEVAVRPRDLNLLVLRDGSIGLRIPLHGTTVDHAESTLRGCLAALGLDGDRLTMKRHYKLPSHPVAHGAPFDISRGDAFEQLAAWYADASVVLEEFKARIASDEVRCWPHHFDIATFVSFGSGRSSSIGMLPGDEMFPEPYFYVNANPPPRVVPDESSLSGGGVWNVDGWFGAVLRGSRLTVDPSAQAEQIRAFLDSAFETCTSLLKG